MEDVSQIVENYAELVVVGDDAIERWLTDQRVSNPDRTGIHADYGPLLSQVQTRCRPANPIVQAIRTHLARSGIVLKKWSYFYSESEELDAISGAEAARTLGVTKVGLADLVRRGVNEADVRRGGGRRITSVSRSSVSRLVNEFSAGLTVRQMAGMLGISKHQVEKIYYAKIIDSLPKLGKRNVRFRKEVPSELEFRIKQVISMRRITGEIVSLAQVPSRHQEEFSAILVRVLSGDLPCLVQVGTLPIFQRVYVRVGDLRGQGLGVREAASLLGLHSRMIPHLVSAGCLGRNVGEDRSYRLISPEDIVNFKRSYVLTREVSVALNTNSRTAIARLYKAGCIPVIMPSSALQISAVWRRSDVVAAGLL